MAHWMRAQAKEETEHAMRFYDYINSRGNHVELLPISNMPTSYTSPIAAFQEALKHEQLVTSLINKMYAEAVALNDYASQIFLQWYISEQVEEEEQVQTIIDQLEAVKDSMAGTFAVNSQLSKRQ
jgi:ferritin